MGAYFPRKGELGGQQANNPASAYEAARIRALNRFASDILVVPISTLCPPVQDAVEGFHLVFLITLHVNVVCADRSQRPRCVCNWTPFSWSQSLYCISCMKHLDQYWNYPLA